MRHILGVAHVFEHVFEISDSIRILGTLGKSEHTADLILLR